MALPPGGSWIADAFFAAVEGASEEGKALYDQLAGPMALKYIASTQFDAFGDALLASLPDGSFLEPPEEAAENSKDEADDTFHVPTEASRKRRKSITSMLGSGHLMVRYSRDKQVWHAISHA